MFSRKQRRQGKRRPPRGQWDGDGPRFALPGLKPVRMGIGVNDNDDALDDEDEAAWATFWREENRRGAKKPKAKSRAKSGTGKSPARKKPASRSTRKSPPPKKKPSRTKASSARAASQSSARRTSG